ncbi:hypothetical protein LYSBPC_12250 [Lysinibacillus piscis]|uniref:Uncharacterized protein n=1 Tax=Lysinibacillus piscis TaxID=2518931 RepID=A0ABQ5NJ06_9BACI|nr:hypothetical protein LYSBPC_12250 [Lysinibacillus sp. KH24]
MRDKVYIYDEIVCVALDKGNFLVYIKCNKVVHNETMKSHITKGNRVLMDTFCNM